LIPSLTPDEIKISSSTQGGADARTAIKDNFSGLEAVGRCIRLIIRGGMSV